MYNCTYIVRLIKMFYVFSIQIIGTSKLSNAHTHMRACPQKSSSLQFEYAWNTKGGTPPRRY
jgi:hypothetical protein